MSYVFISAWAYTVILSLYTRTKFGNHMSVISMIGMSCKLKGNHLHKESSCTGFQSFISTTGTSILIGNIDKVIIAASGSLSPLSVIKKFPSLNGHWVSC